MMNLTKSCKLVHLWGLQRDMNILQENYSAIDRYNLELVSWTLTLVQSQTEKHNEHGEKPHISTY